MAQRLFRRSRTTAGLALTCALLASASTPDGDAAARAGIPDAGLHTLRHSAATVMLTNGVPLKVVSELLGHSSIAITGDVYGHVSPDVSRDAVRTLGEVLGDLGRANGGQNAAEKRQGRSRSPGNGP